MEPPLPEVPEGRPIDVSERERAGSNGSISNGENQPLRKNRSKESLRQKNRSRSPVAQQRNGLSKIASYGSLADKLDEIGMF